MYWVLHIAAILFFFPALFITIPFHIMGKKEAARERLSRNINQNTGKCSSCTNCNNCGK